jgi:sulfotransferase family protein
VWPNLFVVGAARAGTTSLWHYLDSHPDVFMSREKEPNFFSGVEAPLATSRLDEGSYLRLFREAGDARYRGEASTSYLCSERATARIRAASPEARVVISLRDPVDRLVSAHEFRVLYQQENRSLAEILDDPDYTGDRYTPNVARWLQAFPGAVHVLFYEELTADPEGQMRRLFSFLGVDETAAAKVVAERHNPGRLARNRVSRSLLGSRAAHRFARQFVPARLRSPLMRVLTTSRGERESAPGSVSERLTELYREDVAALEQLLGRKSPWERFR